MSLLAKALTVFAFSIALSAQVRPADSSAAVPFWQRQNPFDALTSFSATLNGGMGLDHNRKIYRSAHLMRLQFEDFYRITDLNTLTTWDIHPDSCVKINMPDAATYPFSAFRDFRVERLSTEEKESVDGHVCRIENVTFSLNDASPLIVKMKLWRAEDLGGFPIRIEADSMGKTIKLSYTDVSLQPPDPKLFARPAKCLDTGAGSGQTKPPTARRKPANPKKN